MPLLKKKTDNNNNNIHDNDCYNTSSNNKITNIINSEVQKSIFTSGNKTNSPNKLDDRQSDNSNAINKENNNKSDHCNGNNDCHKETYSRREKADGCADDVGNGDAMKSKLRDENVREMQLDCELIERLLRIAVKGLLAIKPFIERSVDFFIDFLSLNDILIP